MSTARALAITKDLTIPISVGLLMALVVGVWALAIRVQSWESRLDSFEDRFQETYSYRMAREAWHEAGRLNPGFNVPDVAKVRAEYQQ